MNYNLHKQHTNMAGEDLAVLVAGLHDKDGLVRRHARRALVEEGEAAVPALINELNAPTDYTRWEAAKALCEIQAPEAVPALVKRLDDENFSIRWLAAEALASLGEVSLVPLLQALEQHSDSIWLRRGAHHVFRALAKEHGLGSLLDQVIKALDGMEPMLEAPIAAERVLEVLEGVG
jgi:HEAT repeat protein